MSGLHFLDGNKEFTIIPCLKLGQNLEEKAGITGIRASWGKEIKSVSVDMLEPILCLVYLRDIKERLRCITFGRCQTNGNKNL